MRCIRKMKECVGKTFDFEEKRALIKAVERYLTSGFKADSIFEKSFYAGGYKLKSGDTNAVFKTLLRNLLSIENIVSKLCKKPPRIKKCFVLRMCRYFKPKKGVSVCRFLGGICKDQFFKGGIGFSKRSIEKISRRI